VTTDELTPRERDVLAFIVRTQRLTAAPPTGREIADRFGVSAAIAHVWLGRLKVKGYITWQPYRKRTLSVLRPPATDEELEKRIAAALRATEEALKR
jgi:SOS-response transcriptional repressor LexA